MKKVVCGLLFLLTIFVAAYSYWSYNYKRNLDFFTAYNSYLSSGCKACLDYFNNLTADDIADLEVKTRFGIVQYVTQVHAFYDSGSLSHQQESENKRIEKLLILLVKKGANINYSTEGESPYTALYATAQKGNPRLVKILLENGADPIIRDAMPNRNLLPIEVARQQLDRFKDDPVMQKALKDVISMLSNHGPVTSLDE